LTLEAFQERIRDAASRGMPLRLRGGGSKDFYGNEPRGEILDTRSYSGIVTYEPTELVITARCGTPLVELEKALEENHQLLPFEPPHFGRHATLGGCVAAGLSGPRRMAAGALRDFMLGVKLVDGRGRSLAFGGQVMKNVAGYDVARLASGSLGTLGLIAEVSLKVLPLPAHELSVRLQMSEQAALETMNRWAAQPLPISATAWRGGELTVRLSGSEAGVRAAATKIGGEIIEGGPFWRGVREHTDAFFAGPDPLWRVAVPSTVAPLDLAGSTLIEWSGGLRWIKSTIDPATLRSSVAALEGHATLFRGADKSCGCFTPLAPTVLRLHRGLKAAFDSGGIFNPGRMYPEL